MIHRIVITVDPAISQCAWDDFCNVRSLVLQPSGYFKDTATGLRAGYQGSRVSFFTRSAGEGSTASVLLSLMAANFQVNFGGQVVSADNARILVGA